MTIKTALKSKIITREVLEVLKNEGYVIDEKTPKKFIENYNVIFLSLRNNYLKTLDYLINHEEHIGLLDIDIATFYDILNENNYLFKYGDEKYIFRIPTILVYSLDKDMDKTIDELLKSASQSMIDLSKSEWMTIMDLLIQKKFVLNDKNIELLNFNSVFLVASLTNDYNNTMKVLKKYTINKNFSLEFSKQIAEILEKNGFDHGQDTPIMFKNKTCAIIAAMKNNRDELFKFYGYNANMPKKEKDWLIEQLNHHKVPIVDFTQEMINDEYLLEKVIKNKKISDFIIKRILPKNVEYSVEDEKKLLKLLNSNSRTVEEEMKLMYQQNLTRNHLNVLQFLVFQLYAKKVLYKENIKGKDISLFDYNKEGKKRLLGLYDEKGIHLYNEDENLDVEEIFKVINHELFHCMQYRDIKECRLGKDKDIDIYSKDGLLRAYIKSEDYYNINYFNFGIEYDAEFKANMAWANILGIKSNHKLESLKAYKYKEYIKEVLKHSKDSTRYSCDLQRIYKNKQYHLNDLFDFLLKYEVENNGVSELKREIEERFPILTYECLITKKTIRRRTIAEMVNLMNESNTSEKGKQIFAFLLVRKLEDSDPKYKENEKELSKLINNGNISNDVKVLLKKVIALAQKRNATKHLKYASLMILENKKANKSNTKTNN